ncbi:MAG: hypothetical protein BIFFINMI_02780 [Phycisphaerae bacterium]|nr:hypothetical protein [Phycisphaerae bacterium]
MNPHRALAAAVAAAVTFAAGSPAMSQPTPSQPTAALVPFDMPWDDASRSITNVSDWLDKPAARLGRIVARDGHLYAGDTRVRLFGVNLCFGACFPTHADADKLAARLARFGINAVRFHHMDMRPAPDGIFQRDMIALDPGQLDRLDYLIAQLKAHGIYANVNLHVSRVYPGQPTWPGMPSFHKGVDNFVPRMIELQRQYARDLLTRRNPYTKLTYAEDPAVVIVEINNENGLMHEWFGGGLDDMPAEYADELTRQWNAWLAKRYGDAAGLAKAWDVGAQPLGETMLTNGDFARGVEGWTVERHEGAKVTATTGRDGQGGKPAATLRIDQPGGTSWHVQFNQSPLAVRRDTSCTLSFWAKADRTRRVSVQIGQAHEPWSLLAAASANLTDKWQRFEFVLPVGAADDRARLNFSDLSAAGATFSFADVSLRPGGVLGLADGERLGRVPLFPRSQLGRRTVAARRDWMRFLWDAERAYWLGMYRYLKDDLHVQSVVVGTIVGCSSPNIMAELDAVDAHAYWQHPQFPGRPWDAADWLVRNQSMADHLPGTIGSLAMRRVAGKPFLVTEYNHAAPNTYSGEAALFLAAMAARQDWDGVFLFAWSHRRDDWNAETFKNFFDIDRHPTRLANLIPAAAMFLRGDVPAARDLVQVVLPPDEEVELIRTRGRAWELVDAASVGVPRAAALTSRVAIRVGADAKPLPGESKPAAAHDVPDSYRVEGGRTVAYVGRAREGQDVQAGDARVVVGPTRQHWLTLAATAMTGDRPFGVGRTLLVATGDVENTAMGWKNAEKSTVGRDWGRAPARVEGIAATVTLDAAPARVRVWALDGRGQRAQELKVADAAGRSRIEIGPQFRTLWYEVEVE